MTRLPFLLGSLIAIFGMVLLAPNGGATGFVAVGQDGTIVATTQGQAWVPLQPSTNEDIYAIEWDGYEWIAVGTHGLILRSTNGTSWAAMGSPTTNDLYGIAQAGTTWIAVGAGGTIISRHDDGPWAAAASGTDTGLTDVATDGKTWVTVGAAGIALHSPDGGLWLPGITPSTSVLWGVSAHNGTFVAVGSREILRSDNGIIWERTVTDGQLRGISHGAGGWLAVGQNRIQTSADGKVWTVVPSDVNNTLFDVTSVAEPHVAIGDAGTVATQWPGLNWTKQAVATQTLYDVASGNVVFPMPEPDEPGTNASFPIQGTAGTDSPVKCQPRRVEAYAGDSITLRATGGKAPYEWDLAGVNDPSSSQILTISFSEPGTYTATVHDSSGSTESSTCQIRVVARPPLGSAESPTSNTTAAQDAQPPTEAEPSDLSLDPADPRPRAMAPQPVSRDTWNVRWYAAFAMLLAALAGAMLWLRPTLAALFSRLKPNRLLEHPLRLQIHATIRAQPGIHMRGLARALEREFGVIHYHLNILVRAGLVQSLCTPSHTRFFLPEVADPALRTAVSAVRSTTTETLLRHVAEHPGTTLEAIAARLGIRYGVVRAHAQRLVDAKLVVRRRDSRILRFSTTPLAELVLTGRAVLPYTHPAGLARASDVPVHGN